MGKKDTKKIGKKVSYDTLQSITYYFFRAFFYCLKILKTRTAIFLEHE